MSSRCGGSSASSRQRPTAGDRVNAVRPPNFADSSALTVVKCRSGNRFPELSASGIRSWTRNIDAIIRGRNGANDAFRGRTIRTTVFRPPRARYRLSANDTNAMIAALLRDLAQTQKSVRSGWGYKRAANAVAALDVPIESLVKPDGSIEKIPHVGPKSEQVILEALRTRGSPTVERAIEAAGKKSDIARRRALRSNYLSRSRVLAALRD